MRKICHLWGKVHLKSPPKKCSFKMIPIIPPSCLWYQQLKLSQYDTLSLISVSFYFHSPSDSFSDFLLTLSLIFQLFFFQFPLTCTRAGFLSVVDSWWGGFMCVGLLCKRNTYIFRMLWSFLFSIEIWLQNQLFRISGFCSLPFCELGCKWVGIALQKKYKSSVCWPANQKKSTVIMSTILM